MPTFVRYFLYTCILSFSVNTEREEQITFPPPYLYQRLNIFCNIKEICIQTALKYHDIYTKRDIREDMQGLTMGAVWCDWWERCGAIGGGAPYRRQSASAWCQVLWCSS